MKNYNELLERVLTQGTLHMDRTGVGTRRIFGAMLEFDLTEGFPVITTRKAPWRSAIAEMVGFINAFRYVKQFEAIGCKFWGANAKDWAGSFGGGYLGRIYGVQAREWDDGSLEQYDQLKAVLDELRTNPDSRRLLVTHWRPDEFDSMALPPCHVQYQFLCDKSKGELSLKFDMRSTDMVLGAPNNIVGYAFLLESVAHAFGYTAKKLIMTMGDCHIYSNHEEGVREMLTRREYELPKLAWEKDAPTLRKGKELEWIESLRPDMFTLLNYRHGEPIKFDMAV
jgi:thymidylate synthase